MNLMAANPFANSNKMNIDPDVVKPHERQVVHSSKQRVSKFAEQEFLFNLIDEAGKVKTSDVHVLPGKGVYFVISNVPVFLGDNPEYASITSDDILHWMVFSEGYADRKVHNPQDLFGEKGHTTVAYDTGSWRVRGSFRNTTLGVSATFRLIPSEIPTLEEFDIPEIMVELFNKKSGLILIEGPTGSGKTTSIAALIDNVNKTKECHIYSIEDPIEFYHKPLGNNVFNMREVGLHASDYPSAVENALRSKPNIIFIGEMLNNSTKKAALHAATTGHLVISTAHAGSVAEAVDGFIGEFPAAEQAMIRSRLSQSLIAIMCQILVPKKTGGLVAVREIGVNSINMAQSIKKGEIDKLAQAMDADRGLGSQTMEEGLARLVIDDIIELEEAKQQAKSTSSLLEAIDKLERQDAIRAQQQQ